MARSCSSAVLLLEYRLPILSWLGETRWNNRVGHTTPLSTMSPFPRPGVLILVEWPFYRRYHNISCNITIIHIIILNSLWHSNIVLYENGPPSQRLVTKSIGHLVNNRLPNLSFSAAQIFLYFRLFHCSFVGLHWTLSRLLKPLPAP